MGQEKSGQVEGFIEQQPQLRVFRELPKGLLGPPGALGMPLTAERSIAVDPRYIPLGAPVFLSTTFPTAAGRCNG